jgi:hypothetical protein
MFLRSMRKVYAAQQRAKTVVFANLVEARIGNQVENRPAAVIVHIAVERAKCLRSIAEAEIAHREWVHHLPFREQWLKVIRSGV